MQWHETEILVNELEEQYPEIEVDELSTSEIYDLILDLSDFSDDPDSIDELGLKRIIEAWSEYRSEK